MLFHFIKWVVLELKKRKLEKEGMSIGKGTLLFSDVAFGSEPYLIHIGSQCLISTGVKFITHDGAIRVIKQKEEYRNIDNKYGKIDIRDNVYLGDNSIIMPNVTIGPDACVLPGAVVYRDVPPGSVAVGNPAVIKRTVDDFPEYYKSELYPYFSRRFFRRRNRG